MATITDISRLLLAVLAALPPLSSAQSSYCSINECDLNRHTMCRFPSSTPASACGPVAANSVSAADQAEILQAHNDLRRAVKNGDYSSYGLPAAKSIPDLAWNSSLAAVAQRWANQCQTEHDECRNMPGMFVGQNLAWSGNRAKDWRQQVAVQWFSTELQYVQSTLNNLRYRGGGAIHLTQVIWAQTTQVGCAYMESTPPGYPYKKRIYFCNYGPRGNMHNQNVYETL
ncbi:Venom allergen 5 [Amphibalanus amphitrite]|uniref:Venom allergen 5 n=1 Tax=Amphibalanus amphitrite TaxID=1232801 RepID=A0A6A4W418_AMPAM|nr:Venom allergen 5 [Amphibalanus amphitrite]